MSFVPSPKIAVSHPAELEVGDRLKLGKRPYRYIGRSEEFPEFANQQNEYVFEADHPCEGNPIDKRRVYTQSELEDLITAGFMSRQTYVSLELKSAVGPQPRS